MKYTIYSKYGDDGFEEVIEEKNYHELALSKEILFEIRSKENIYNIILMNYYEFEKELFEISFKNEIFEPDNSIFNDVISQIDQRILNLLASITFYIDSFKNDLKDKNTEKYPIQLESEYQKICQFINGARKSNNIIKIMSFLRNHIQHNGLLVDSISLIGQNLSDELQEQTLKFYINKNSIKARDFNINDFLDIAENIDLKKFIREYMDFVSEIHHNFREKTNDIVQKARNCFESVIIRYPEYQYLFAAKNVDRIIVDEIDLSLVWDNVRVEMVKKNHVPKCFKRHSLSTK